MIKKCIFGLVWLFAVCVPLQAANVLSLRGTGSNATNELTFTWDANSTISGSSRVVVGILIPEGWRVADKGNCVISFSNGNKTNGDFVFCQFVTDYLKKNNETPAGYYWWGGRVIDKVLFSSRTQFDIDFALNLITDSKTGTVKLRFAAGDDPSATIKQHMISEPFEVQVAEGNKFPEKRVNHWDKITGGFNTDYYSDQDFNSYFLRYYGWNGGDVGISTVLPDGRSIWTWGDYDAGVVNSDRNRLTELAQFPRNGLMVQEPYCDFSAFRLLTNGKQPGQIQPSVVYKDNNGNPLPDGQEWYWPMGGHVYYRNGIPELQVLLEHTLNNGGGQWGMAAVSTDVAVFSLPDLQLVKVVKDRYKGAIGFANIAFRDDDGVVYVYGERNWGICVSSTFVARNSAGDLTAEWEFYNGKTKTWSADLSWQNETNWMDYAVIHNPVFVFKDGGKYFALEQAPCFSPNTYVYDAASPVGPFTNKRLVGVLPAEITSSNFICYIPALHQQFSNGGELMYSVSKNYNGNFDRYGTDQSANYYLPYFFRIKKWRDKLSIVSNDITAGEGRLSAQYAGNLSLATDKNEKTAYTATTTDGSAWIQYSSGDKPLFLRRYTLTSGDGDISKDPLHWQMLGSNDSINWTVLDERYHAAFEERGQTNSYTVPVDRTFRFFRLQILAINGSSDLNIAEWQLFGQYAGFEYKGETATHAVKNVTVSVFPNPATSQLTINSGSAILRNAAVYDITGNKLADVSLADHHNVDISYLKSGMYVLRVVTDSGNDVFKFNKR